MNQLIKKGLKTYLFLAFILVQLCSSAKEKDNQKVYLHDASKVAWDTLNAEFNNGIFNLNLDLINKTNKRRELHTWVFSENVSLSPNDDVDASIMDEDMNAVKMAKELKGLHLEVTPNFNAPPQLIITPLLSDEIVYKAFLKYPILGLQWNDLKSQYILNKDTIITCTLFNYGLDTLFVQSTLSIDKLGEQWEKELIIAPQSKRLVACSIPFYKDWVVSDTTKLTANLQFKNLAIKQNNFSESIELIITPFIAIESSNSNVSLWLLVILVLAFGGWYWFVYRNKPKQSVVFPKPKVLDLEKELLLFKEKASPGNWDGLLKSVGGSSELVIEKTIDKKISKPKSFLRKEIVQRNLLSKYINDKTLNDKLQERGEVDLIKYIGTKFKEAEKFQGILHLNKEWTNQNVQKQIAQLVQQENKKVFEKTKLVQKTKSIQVIQKQATKIRITVDPVYLEQLNQLNNLLADIVELSWEDVPSLFLLKNKFLNYLGIRENKLEAYIKRLSIVPELANGTMDKTELNRFIDVFTDVFNLLSFSELKPFADLFKALDFPLDTYKNMLENLEGYWLGKWDLKVVVPKLFVDLYDEQWHCNSEDVSKILAENAVDIDFELKRGLIKDYSSFGLFSKKLNIVRKAAVYSER